eukprot:1988607-Rhodomonas_salina.2
MAAFLWRCVWRFPFKAVIGRLGFELLDGMLRCVCVNPGRAAPQALGQGPALGPRLRDRSPDLNPNLKP